MKIGIDIDGVIADTIELHAKEFSNHFGYEITCEDILCRFNEIKGGEDFVKDNMELLFCTVKPVDYAAEAINSLHKEHEIYFISARQGKAQDVTLKWFEEHGIVPRNITLTGGKSKVEICKQLSLDLFIEDSVVNVQEIVKAGIPVIIYKRDYNKEFQHEMAVHCENWRYIIEEINRRVLNKL